MLCLPALTPVANDAHAVGDSGECVVASGNVPPFLASADRFGSLPSCIQRSTRCGSIPSKPSITSFCEYFDGPRLGLPPQATRTASSTQTTALASATGLLDEGMKLVVERRQTEEGSQPSDVRLRAPGFRLRSFPNYTVC